MRNPTNDPLTPMLLNINNTNSLLLIKNSSKPLIIRRSNGSCHVGFMSDREKNYDKWIVSDQPVYGTG